MHHLIHLVKKLEVLYLYIIGMYKESTATAAQNKYHEYAGEFLENVVKNVFLFSILLSRSQLL